MKLPLPLFLLIAVHAFMLHTSQSDYSEDLFDSVEKAFPALSQIPEKAKVQDNVEFGSSGTEQCPTNPIAFIPGQEVVPLPLRISGFVDSRNNPVVTTSQQVGITLIETDSFKSSLNSDLNLVDQNSAAGIIGGFTPGTKCDDDHGYGVGGMLAAKRDNNTGIVGALPVTNQKIIAINTVSIGTGRDWMPKLINILKRPGKKIVNRSWWFKPPANPTLADLDASKQRAQMYGALFAKIVNREGLKNNFIAVTIAGNLKNANAEDVNDFAFAGSASSFTVNIQPKYIEECKAALPTYAADCSSLNGSSIIGLNNVLTVQNVSTIAALAPDSSNGSINAVAYMDTTNPATYGPCKAGTKGFPILISGNRYGCILNGGTSNAAPQVAALAALYWQKKPTLNSLQVVNDIQFNSQSDFPIFHNSTFVSRSFCNISSSEALPVINARKLLNASPVYAQIVGSLGVPRAVTMRGDTFFVVDDSNSGRLLRIKPNGIITILATGLGTPNGVAVNGNLIYVTDFLGKGVWQINESTKTKQKLSFVFPGPISITALNGVVYVGSFGNQGNGQLSSITNSGTLTVAKAIIPENATNTLGSPRAIFPICNNQSTSGEYVWSNKLAILDNQLNRLLVVNTQGAQGQILETYSLPKEPNGKKWIGATFLGDHLLLSGGSSLMRLEKVVVNNRHQVVFKDFITPPTTPTNLTGNYFGIFGNYYDLIVTDARGGRLLQMTPYTQVTKK